MGDGRWEKSCVGWVEDRNPTFTNIASVLGFILQPNLHIYSPFTIHSHSPILDKLSPKHIHPQHCQEIRQRGDWEIEDGWEG